MRVKLKLRFATVFAQSASVAAAWAVAQNDLTWYRNVTSITVRQRDGEPDLWDVEAWFDHRFARTEQELSALVGA